MRLRHPLLLALVAFVGCSNSVRPDPLTPGNGPGMGIQYPATVSATAYTLPAPGLPPRLSIGVRLTNNGATPALVEHGACSVAVWLYRTGDTAPSWQTFSSPEVACILIGYSRTIVPGEAYSLAGALVGVDTPVNPLAPGTYRVRVAIRRERTDGSTEPLQILDGGEVTLP
jgi:hypothetical protein